MSKPALRCWVSHAVQSWKFCCMLMRQRELKKKSLGIIIKMCDFARTLKGSLGCLRVPGSHFENHGLAVSVSSMWNTCFTNLYLIQVDTFYLICSMMSFLERTFHPCSQTSRKYVLLGLFSLSNMYTLTIHTSVWMQKLRINKVR